MTMTTTIRGSRLKPRVADLSGDHCAAPGERIIEITFADGTGLLVSLRQPTDSQPARVELYRADANISMRVGGIPLKQ